MPWQMQDPFASGLGAASGVLQGQQQAKETALEKQRQDALDRQNAALAASQMAYQTAQTTHTNNADARDTKLDAVAATQRGDGLTPPPMPQNHGKPMTAKQLADYWLGTASYYGSKGASEAAKNALSTANSYQQNANDQDAAAIAVRKELNDEIQKRAEREHWSAQEKIAAKAETDKLIISSNHDHVSLANAATAAMSRIQAASTAAAAHVQAAQIGAQGAMDRTVYSNKEQDHRAHYTQDNVNRRFNVGLEHKDKMAKTPGMKFRSINPTTQALMAKEANDAISKGAPRDAVLKRMAQTHGISVDEASGVLDDNSGNDE